MINFYEIAPLIFIDCLPRVLSTNQLLLNSTFLRQNDCDVLSATNFSSSSKSTTSPYKSLVKRANILDQFFIALRLIHIHCGERLLAPGCRVGFSWLTSTATYFSRICLCLSLIKSKKFGMSGGCILTAKTLLPGGVRTHSVILFYTLRRHRPLHHISCVTTNENSLLLSLIQI